MILYIHRDNKEKYLKLETQFKKFIKKESIYLIPEGSISIIALGLNQTIKGGAVLLPTNSGSAVLSALEVSKTLSCEDNQKTYFEICAALQEYCLFNNISQISASVNTNFEARLKKYNWQYKTLINRQSEEENSIVSLEVSHDQFIGFIFDGDISPSFACNSPDKNKYKKLVA